MARKIRTVLFALVAAAVIFFIIIMISNGNNFSQMLIIPLLGGVLALIVHAVTLPFIKNTVPYASNSNTLSPALAKKYAIPLVIIIAVWLVIARPWEVSLGPSNEESVSRSSMGDDWPLTVESGTLMCLDGVSVVFEVPSGIRYAVNGTAKDLTVYPDIDEIWASDGGDLGLKKNIGPLIDRGLGLCE